MSRLALAATFLALTVPIASAQSGSPEEQSWRKTAEAIANGGGGEEGYSNSLTHKHVVEACGHDVKVVFDWKAFKMAEWVGSGKASVDSVCVQDILDAIATACGDPKTKASASNIRTVTCHYKNDAELPRSSGNENDKLPGIEHKWDGGPNVDKSFCTRSSITSSDPHSEGFAWLKDTLSRRTSVPGSPEEQSWHKTAEEIANGGGGEEGYTNKLRHKEIVEACGHDVQVLFDWKTFKASDWVGVGKGSVDDTCVQDILGAIVVACQDPKTKAAASAIRTVTCHQKNDAELPRSSVIAGDKLPGIEHKWPGGGSNIDKSFCPGSRIYSGDPHSEGMAWLKDALSRPASRR